MQLRDNNLSKVRRLSFDALVIGGGINGAVSAAAMSARGLKVALIDRGDFAGSTSQESSNLAWGGIKYMETYEFGLVRKLCMSRNKLMRSYPSTVQEIRFFTTIKKGFRYPPWFLYLGGVLYWFMGNGFTRFPHYLTPERISREEPIVNTEGSTGGFEYSDAFLHDNDARFVFNFIRRAMDYGCIAANYVESVSAHWADRIWTINARDNISGEEFQIRAGLLINACGPFVDDHNRLTGQTTKYRHAFSKGIHLIVDRITQNKRVLTFFADDGRLFFVIPMGPKTCIGTTDTRMESPIATVTPEDRKFVLDNINARLRLPQPLTESDVVAERCGVRPLAVQGDNGAKTDWLQLSRKHVIEVDAETRHISIFGGKLTDCLNVGDEICQAAAELGLYPPYPNTIWYGEPPNRVKEEFMHQARLMDLDSLTPPSSSEKLSIRLWRRYAAHAFDLLETIRADPRQAELLIENAEYLRCEIEQAARREMVTKLDDFLRRRSKISLVVRRDKIKSAQGLREACRILFGDEADEKWAEYFKETSA
ncbi:Glycerol-3-phosphate dehydrogenase [Hahella chejuensis KCTC 2396]|uniref:Glycerol-3-phosphate dehydrogenase n=1 Tax=Hahella chejuensis (strain KCTC 2396) TaxID=349521 RepID=Q2SEM4_HAHCH|nr:glycerol-3-phosphate dehydrogenase/oxidase [Hahella chejuensis]ABC30900.1 Glycerol-3-phosphate dehydrogenase [Hahella chejuensis KCTC 2396]